MTAMAYKIMTHYLSFDPKNADAALWITLRRYVGSAKAKCNYSLCVVFIGKS